MRKLLPFFFLAAFGFAVGRLLYPIMQIWFSLEQLFTHF